MQSILNALLQAVIAVLIAWLLVWLIGFIPFIPWSITAIQVVVGLAAWALAAIVMGMLKAKI